MSVTEIIALAKDYGIVYPGFKGTYKDIKDSVEGAVAYEDEIFAQMARLEAAGLA